MVPTVLRAGAKGVGQQDQTTHRRSERVSSRFSVDYAVHALLHERSTVAFIMDPADLGSLMGGVPRGGAHGGAEVTMPDK